jgi:hypothetical protein
MHGQQEACTVQKRSNLQGASRTQAQGAGQSRALGLHACAPAPFRTPCLHAEHATSIGQPPHNHLSNLHQKGRHNQHSQPRAQSCV